MRIDGRTLSHETSETIRRMAVRRVQEGEAPSDVIKGYGLCRTTIYKWLTAVRRRGPAALTARTHPGRKPALTPRQKLQVRRWINGKDPRQYGFDFGLWTRQIVAALIARRVTRRRGPVCPAAPPRLQRAAAVAFIVIGVLILSGKFQGTHSGLGGNCPRR